MRASTRERALRVLLAAFMNSPLTAQELRELSEDMSRTPKFAADLQSLLITVAAKLSEKTPQKALERSDDQAVEQALSSVKRRRMSKNEFLRIVEHTAPNVVSRLRSDNVTLNEMVRKFFELASDVQRHEFLALISPKGAEVAGDAYLRGIVESR